MTQQEQRCRYLVEQLLAEYPPQNRPVPAEGWSRQEFLWALNYPLETIQYLKDCFERRQAVQGAVHDRMLRIFETYIVVGGMPEVVQTYVSTRDITETVYIQKQILSLYRQDIFKYAQGLMSLKIRQIFDSIPSQLDDKKQDD